MVYCNWKLHPLRYVLYEQHRSYKTKTFFTAIYEARAKTYLELKLHKKSIDKIYDMSQQPAACWTLLMCMKNSRSAVIRRRQEWLNQIYDIRHTQTSLLSLKRRPAHSDQFLGYHLVTRHNLRPGDIIMREHLCIVAHRKCANCQMPAATISI